MNILLINYEYPPLGGGGGIAMMEVAEELAKRHSVHVLTSGARGLDQTTHHKMLDLTVHRAPVAGRSDRATASFVSMLNFLSSGARLGRKLLKDIRFDVVNTWFAIPSGIPGGWLTSRYRIPHVLTVIGGDIYDPSKWYSPHSFWPASLAVKWALRHANAHIAISSDISQRTREYFQFKGDIEVVPLGIRVPQFSTVTRAELSLKMEKKYIVTVGRLVRRKDYPTLIKALATLERTDTELLFIGDGPEQSNLQALAVELGIADKIKFLGFVSDDKKYQVLANSNVFALASLHEGFGVVYLEAMFCGLPIIAANRGGQVDILRDNATGYLVPVGDVPKMAAAIGKLLDHADLREKIGRSNKERAKSYAIENIAAQYERKFEEVIKAWQP